MTQEQIDYNYASAKEYSITNNCTVWIMCSRYFNSGSERDRELVATHNELTMQIFKTMGFWVYETVFPPDTGAVR